MLDDEWSKATVFNFIEYSKYKLSFDLMVKKKLLKG